MRRHFLNVLFALIASLTFCAAASAEASCTSWLWQEGGWYWKQCVNDDGSQHCYHAKDAQGSGAYEISCKA